jgi:hypothetical protein
MDQIDAELHPIYGAIPADGEFVQQGDILGFSVDARELVTAPTSGWVRLVSYPDPSASRLYVYIHASRADSIRRTSNTAA